MPESNFNQDAARKNLQRREVARAVDREEFRLKMLQKTTEILLKEFQGKNIEIWLIGSIIQPNRFSTKSDIDIVLKNYFDDRFALWSHLERQIKHDVEIIRYEECSFQEEIQKLGMKVL